jgi:hypothetical protein
VAIDLATLVDAVRVSVNPPGSDLFPDATDDSWIGALINSFWEIRLYGLLASWEEDAASRDGPLDFTEGIVTPLGVDETYDDPTGYAPTDMGRDYQQLVVLWTSWRTVLNRMGSLSTTFRAKAGPVEYETQNAATVLKSVLDALKQQLDAILGQLRNVGADTTIVLDAMVERSYAQAVGETWWVSH